MYSIVQCHKLYICHEILWKMIIWNNLFFVAAANYFCYLSTRWLFTLWNVKKLTSKTKRCSVYSEICRLILKKKIWIKYCCQSSNHFRNKTQQLSSRGHPEISHFYWTIGWLVVCHKNIHHHLHHHSLTLFLFYTYDIHCTRSVVRMIDVFFFLCKPQLVTRERGRKNKCGPGSILWL